MQEWHEVWAAPSTHNRTNLFKKQSSKEYYQWNVNQHQKTLLIDRVKGKIAIRHQTVHQTTCTFCRLVTASRKWVVNILTTIWHPVFQMLFYGKRLSTRSRFNHDNIEYHYLNIYLTFDKDSSFKRSHSNQPAKAWNIADASVWDQPCTVSHGTNFFLIPIINVL